MNDPYKNLFFPEGGFSITPFAAHLYVPPITWKGDPKGHVGMSDAFFFVLSGECCVMVEEESFLLRPGDLAYLPMGKMRTYSAMCKDLTMYEINFECYINQKPWYEALGFSYDNYVVHTENIAAVSKFFEDSIRYEMNKNIIYDAIFCTNIASVIREYTELRYEQDMMTDPFRDVISYMQQHIHELVKIEELAAVCFMQPTYFIKKFRSAFGMPPIVYFNKLKMYRAMTLLASTNRPVCDVGRSVGIYDNSYFSRMFKQHCGMTPGEYKMILKREEASF